MNTRLCADAYKRLLLGHHEYGALNVYTALAYSRLDYFDVSQARAGDCGLYFSCVGG